MAPGTPTHQTLSRHSHCISYCSCSHQLPSRLFQFCSLWRTSICHIQTPTSLKLSRQNCSPVRQSSPLRTSSTATLLATCSQQNTFQTCHHHIKPSVQTLLNISLHTFAIISQSVLCAPQTSTFLSPLHPTLTWVLVLYARPLLSFGTHHPSQSVHLPPSTPSNAA